MANAIYPLAKKQFLQAGLNLSSSNIKIALVDLDDYTYSAAHEFYTDLAGVVGTTANLSGKTFGNDGSFDSSDPVATSVTGDEFEALVMYIDTGTPSTSRLIAYFDTGISGAPLTPDGSNVQITVDSDGWFIL
jgi:hypothetical protein